MATTSVLVHDTSIDQYAYGYQHNNGEIPYNELIDSALSVNKDREDSDAEPIEPMAFLAEWHELALKKWDEPSEFTIEAIEDLSEITRVDDHHYHVKMEQGRIWSIVAYRKGTPFMTVTF